MKWGPNVNAKMISRSKEKLSGEKRYYLTIELENGGNASSFPIELTKEDYDHCVLYFRAAKIPPRTWESSLVEYTHYHFTTIPDPDPMEDSISL